MEQSESSSQIAAKLAKPRCDGVEDRLSALPDEVLVLILECLDTTAEAARTSVLARRWRRLWPLLSKLRFHLRPDGDRIRDLLDAADATPALRYISVTTKGAAADSATAWLPAAARRLSGGLVYHNMPPDLDNNNNNNVEEEKARRAGNVQLPCFENATTIELRQDRLGIALPSEGVFTRLTDLELRSVEFRGPCELGDLVSSPRCPCLQKLSIVYSTGLGDLSIHSQSLLQIRLMNSNLRQLTIVTPLLQKLSVLACFPPFTAAGDDQSEQQRANITAPQMVSLVWTAPVDALYFHLGKPRELQTGYFYVYGGEASRKGNHACLRLLQQFKAIYSLHLALVYLKHVCDHEYLLGDMTALLQVTFLRLDVCTRGHGIGACLFHLLRLCIGLRRLTLALFDRPSKLTACPCHSGCVCDQPKNWKTDELVLDHLEDVHIFGLRGAEHEVAFVQRFLGWATVLKSLRITFVNEMNEGKIAEFRQALAGYFRPETCLQFETSDIK